MMSERPEVVLPAELCHLHSRATPLHALNFMTVGVPSYHVPEQAVETGFVELQPDSVTRLDVKIPSFMDFYVDRVLVDLWRIDGVAPARTLAWVRPFAEIPFGLSIRADVRLQIEDSAFEVNYGRQELPWHHFASSAASPHILMAPFTWQGGRLYNLQVRNRELTTTFAISIVFVGRRRRVEESMAGWTSDERRLLDWYLDRERELGNLTRGYLTGDHVQNIRGIGRLKTSPLPLQPVAVTVGAFDTIQQRVPNLAVVSQSQRYYFNLRQQMGSQEQGETGKVVGNIAPVVTRIFDDMGQYWITNGWVPFRSIYGTGELPGRLPVDWAWGRGGDIQYEFRMATTTATSVMVDIEGIERALAPGTGAGEGW